MIDTLARVAMASQEWIEIYRSYSGDELDDEIDSLKQQLSIFSSQSVGSKSFTRDLETLKNRLHAATRVKKEMGQPDVGSSGVTDFSGVNPESDITDHKPNFYRSTVL